MATYPSFSDTNSKERLTDPFRDFLPDDLVTDGLDLRQHIAAFVAERGHWIVFRKYDTNRRPAGWDEAMQTNMGGEPWVYTDTLIRVRKSIYISSRNKGEAVGIADMKTEMYYLPYTLEPSDVDKIIEIDPCYGDRPASYTIRQVKKIDKVHPMRDISGRVEFYEVIVGHSSPTGSQSLK